ncbi:hypothetical protein HYY73_04580 [Candidatus Woesearchaeota archaeon]|nr:hypothetical protein [Candidatus Woesearchaeota archaeon]
MSLVDEAFSRLFPEAAFTYAAHLRYSGKFKQYNATVRKAGGALYFNLSRSWKSTSEEIVIGLIQHLLVKILRSERLAAAKDNSGKISSLNMQLYDDFIKGISEVAAVNNGSGSSDESLESSFARVNEKYFFGIADKPNLRWGLGSFRKLASYDYHTNTITVSSLFRDAPQQLLDYLMYHELLHKKLKFSSSNGRVQHHSSEFRRLELDFEGSSTIEQKLNLFLRSSRRQLRNVRQRPNWLRLFSFQ